MKQAYVSLADSLTKKPKSFEQMTIFKISQVRPSVHLLCSDVFLEAPIQLLSGESHVPLKPLGFEGQAKWLAAYDLAEVQDFATKWMWSYNHDRPNMALGGFTPKQRLAMAA